MDRAHRLDEKNGVIYHVYSQSYGHKNDKNDLFFVSFADDLRCIYLGASERSFKKMKSSFRKRNG